MSKVVSVEIRVPLSLAEDIVRDELTAEDMQLMLGAEVIEKLTEKLRDD